MLMCAKQAGGKPRLTSLLCLTGFLLAVSKPAPGKGTSNFSSSIPSVSTLPSGSTGSVSNNRFTAEISSSIGLRSPRNSTGPSSSAGRPSTISLKGKTITTVLQTGSSSLVFNASSPVSTLPSSIPSSNATSFSFLPTNLTSSIYSSPILLSTRTDVQNSSRVGKSVPMSVNPTSFLTPPFVTTVTESLRMTNTTIKFQLYKAESSSEVSSSISFHSSRNFSGPSSSTGRPSTISLKSKTITTVLQTGSLSFVLNASTPVSKVISSVPFSNTTSYSFFATNLTSSMYSSPVLLPSKTPVENGSSVFKSMPTSIDATSFPNPALVTTVTESLRMTNTTIKFHLSKTEISLEVSSSIGLHSSRNFSGPSSSADRSSTISLKSKTITTVLQTGSSSFVLNASTPVSKVVSSVPFSNKTSYSVLPTNLTSSIYSSPVLLSTRTDVQNSSGVVESMPMSVEATSFLTPPFVTTVTESLRMTNTTIKFQLSKAESPSEVSSSISVHSSRNFSGPSSSTGRPSTISRKSKTITTVLQTGSLSFVLNASTPVSKVISSVPFSNRTSYSFFTTNLTSSMYSSPVLLPSKTPVENGSSVFKSMPTSIDATSFPNPALVTTVTESLRMTNTTIKFHLSKTENSLEVSSCIGLHSSRNFSGLSSSADRSSTISLESKTITVLQTGSSSFVFNASTPFSKVISSVPFSNKTSYSVLPTNLTSSIYSSPVLLSTRTDVQNSSGVVESMPMSVEATSFPTPPFVTTVTESLRMTNTTIKFQLSKAESSSEVSSSISFHSSRNFSGPSSSTGRPSTISLKSKTITTVLQTGSLSFVLNASTPVSKVISSVPFSNTTSYSFFTTNLTSSMYSSPVLLPSKTPVENGSSVYKSMPTSVDATSFPNPALVTTVTESLRMTNTTVKFHLSKTENSLEVSSSIGLRSPRNSTGPSSSAGRPSTISLKGKTITTVLQTGSSSLVFNASSPVSTLPSSIPSSNATSFSFLPTNLTSSIYSSPVLLSTRTDVQNSSRVGKSVPMLVNPTSFLTPPFVTTVTESLRMTNTTIKFQLSKAESSSEVSSSISFHSSRNFSGPSSSTGRPSTISLKSKTITTVLQTGSLSFVLNASTPVSKVISSVPFSNTTSYSFFATNLTSSMYSSPVLLPSKTPVENGSSVYKSMPTSIDATSFPNPALVTTVTESLRMTNTTIKFHLSKTENSLEVSSCIGLHSSRNFSGPSSSADRSSTISLKSKTITVLQTGSSSFVFNASTPVSKVVSSVPFSNKTSYSVLPTNLTSSIYSSPVLLSTRTDVQNSSGVVESMPMSVEATSFPTPPFVTTVTESLRMTNTTIKFQLSKAESSSEVSSSISFHSSRNFSGPSSSTGRPSTISLKSKTITTVLQTGSSSLVFNASSPVSTLPSSIPSSNTTSYSFLPANLTSSMYSSPVLLSTRRDVQNSSSLGELMSTSVNATSFQVLSFLTSVTESLRTTNTTIKFHMYKSESLLETSSSTGLQSSKNFTGRPISVGGSSTMSLKSKTNTSVLQTGLSSFVFGASTRVFTTASSTRSLNTTSYSFLPTNLTSTMHSSRVLLPSRTAVENSSSLGESMHTSVKGTSFQIPTLVASVTESLRKKNTTMKFQLSKSESLLEVSSSIGLPSSTNFTRSVSSVGRSYTVWPKNSGTTISSLVNDTKTRIFTPPGTIMFSKVLSGSLIPLSTTLTIYSVSNSVIISLVMPTSLVSVSRMSASSILPSSRYMETSSSFIAVLSTMPRENGPSTTLKRVSASYSVPTTSVMPTRLSSLVVRTSFGSFPDETINYHSARISPTSTAFVDTSKLMHPTLSSIKTVSSSQFTVGSVTSDSTVIQTTSIFSSQMSVSSSKISRSIYFQPSASSVSFNRSVSVFSTFSVGIEISSTRLSAISPSYSDSLTTISKPGSSKPMSKLSTTLLLSSEDKTSFLYSITSAYQFFTYSAVSTPGMSAPESSFDRLPSSRVSSFVSVVESGSTLGELSSAESRSTASDTGVEGTLLISSMTQPSSVVELQPTRTVSTYPSTPVYSLSIIEVFSSCRSCSGLISTAELVSSSIDLSVTSITLTPVPDEFKIEVELLIPPDVELNESFKETMEERLQNLYALGEIISSSRRRRAVKRLLFEIPAARGDRKLQPAKPNNMMAKVNFKNVRVRRQTENETRVQIINMTRVEGSEKVQMVFYVSKGDKLVHSAEAEKILNAPSEVRTVAKLGYMVSGKFSATKTKTKDPVKKGNNETLFIILSVTIPIAFVCFSCIFIKCMKKRKTSQKVKLKLNKVSVQKPEQSTELDEKTNGTINNFEERYVPVPTLPLKDYPDVVVQTPIKKQRVKKEARPKSVPEKSREEVLVTPASAFEDITRMSYEGSSNMTTIDEPPLRFRPAVRQDVKPQAKEPVVQDMVGESGVPQSWIEKKQQVDLRSRRKEKNTENMPEQNDEVIGGKLKKEEAAAATDSDDTIQIKANIEKWRNKMRQKERIKKKYEEKKRVEQDKLIALEERKLSRREWLMAQPEIQAILNGDELPTASSLRKRRYRQKRWRKNKLPSESETENEVVVIPVGEKKRRRWRKRSRQVFPAEHDGVRLVNVRPRKPRVYAFDESVVEEPEIGPMYGQRPPVNTGISQRTLSPMTPEEYEQMINQGYVVNSAYEDEYMDPFVPQYRDPGPFERTVHTPHYIASSGQVNVVRDFPMGMQETSLSDPVYWTQPSSVPNNEARPPGRIYDERYLRPSSMYSPAGRRPKLWTDDNLKGIKRPSHYTPHQGTNTSPRNTSFRSMSEDTPTENQTLGQTNLIVRRNSIEDRPDNSIAQTPEAELRNYTISENEAKKLVAQVLRRATGSSQLP